MKARLVKPVKYDLSSRSSVFTPVSPISKTIIILSQKLSGKYLVKFYRILVSGTSPNNNNYNNYYYYNNNNNNYYNNNNNYYYKNNNYYYYYIQYYYYYY